MIDVLVSEPLLAIVTALVSIGLGIFVRFASRNDKHDGFSLADWAVANEVMVALVVVLATKSIEYLFKRNQPGIDEAMRLAINVDMAKCILGIIVLVFSLWIISTIIRKKGWENQNGPDPIWGVLLPNFISLVILFEFFNQFNFLYR